MLLDVEIVVDGGVDGEEPLGRALGFKLLLLSLALSDREVRVVGPVVGAHPASAMAFGQSEIAHRGAM